MTDLAREIAELLPCSGSSPQCDDRDPARCTPCRERPAILALIRTLLREERERCAEIVDENPFDGSGDKCIARTIRNLGDRE